VDEVGVAPACGPVVAAAVIMRPNCHRIPGVRDSKTLSAAQREALAPEIRRRAVAIGIGAASVREIDTINIYQATHLAMRRALARLGGHDHVLVDGLRIAGFEAHVGPYDAIVDGDALVYSIACASVVAKVVRDRLMANLAHRHPGYGWERNAGYATGEHRAAMAALGVTPHHRRSFITTRRVLDGGEQLGFGLDLEPASPALELALAGAAVAFDGADLAADDACLELDGGEQSAGGAELTHDGVDLAAVEAALALDGTLPGADIGRASVDDPIAAMGGR
jgi:ribonuclease HII